MNYEAREGQDIFDVSIQFYGDIETGLFEILTTNNLNLDSRNLSGANLTLNNENTIKNNIANHFSNANFTPNNSGLEIIQLVLGDFNNDFNNNFFI
jgi:hypothetical protein